MKYLDVFVINADKQNMHCFLQCILSPELSEIFSQWLKIFKQNFTGLLYVHIYTKHNFFELSISSAGGKQHRS